MRSQARLDPVAEEYGVASRYLSLEEMLSDARLDILSVASPNKLHKDMTWPPLKPVAMFSARSRRP